MKKVKMKRNEINSYTVLKYANILFCNYLYPNLNRFAPSLTGFVKYKVIKFMLL